MAGNRGRSYTRQSEPNYPMELSRYFQPSQHNTILPEPPFAVPNSGLSSLVDWDNINLLHMSENLRNRDNLCNVDLGNYQASSPYPWSEQVPDSLGQLPLAALDDSGSSSRTSPDRLSRSREVPASPSSMTSVDGSYETIPGDEVRYHAKL
jgi:hypothetical protein